MAENSLWRNNPLTLREIAGRKENKILRYNTILDDLFVCVNVFQKQIQRIHPLNQSLFQLHILLMGDDSGYSIKREQLLMKRVVLINTEFDTISR